MLGVSRSVYHTAKAEKDARAEEHSAVKRLLSRNDIVIADGLNYIKGFRYQLYCDAKEQKTPSCVVSFPGVLWAAVANHARGTHRDASRQVPQNQQAVAGGQGKGWRV